MAPSAAIPSFSVLSGTYTSAQTITISVATPGATIYYTTDGTTPSVRSTVYGGPITISSTATLEAIAVSSGYASSDVAIAVYTIARPANYWHPPEVGSVNSLGTLLMPKSPDGFVPILSPTIAGSSDDLICLSTSWDSTGTSLIITYSESNRTLHVTIEVTPTNQGIQATLIADQAIVKNVDFGQWGTALKIKSVPVPYYSSAIWYAQALSEYMNAWWDWHSTNASLLRGTSATYLPKTDASRNIMRETLYVAVSTNVDDVFPYPGNAPSPYLSIMAGRTVYDITDNGFLEIQQSLAMLGDYGLGNCLAIIHNWQFAGFDNALPETYPANPSLGGSEGLSSAIDQGAKNGCLMGVHENYVDYYPNYPGFSADAVALNSDGTYLNGWYNSASGIQSYSTKPSHFVTNAMTQSPVIHEVYGTTAAYTDVNSAAPIYSRLDFDARTPGAAKLVTGMQASQSLWAYERAIHHGPDVGEGGNHWYYSGLLDGVDARLGIGTAASNRDTSVPLFVDFDLLRIHPLQVNYGMGNYECWTSDKSHILNSTVQLDAYRMQEIAFGHAPALGPGTWNNLPAAFTETNLVSPVAASYGSALATSIQYFVNDSWVSSSAAAQSGQFSQVQVTYNNGTQVIANSAIAPLRWNGLTIPQYGWAAVGSNLLAYTADCGSTLCDYAQTSSSYFANARNQSDIEAGAGYAAPAVISVQQEPGTKFAITYGWQVHLPLGPWLNYRAFVHFVDDSVADSANPGIIFGNDHALMRATTSWLPGQDISDGPWTVTIPSSVADGTYSIRVGLYDPATGNRLLLCGVNDGSNRYIVGYLTVSGGGTKVSFTPPIVPARDPRLNSSGALVNFGTIQTDGMVSITKSDGMWVLRPYPRFRNFTLLLNVADFPKPANVQGIGSKDSTIMPVSTGSYWSFSLNGSNYYTWNAN